MKVAIYSRKSRFSATGDSIDNQIQLCKEYCSSMMKNAEISEFLIYEDEGFSGGNTNRPNFQKLMQDAKAKKFEILICYRLDRISRNVADFSNTLEILQRYDIDFISIREQFDTSTPMGRAMIYIASVFAQLERETIAERIRDNMLELAKSGRWLGGVTPIGYKSSPISFFDENMKERKMHKLTPIPEQLKIVQLIYKLYLEHKSLSKVEAYFLENRITTRRGGNFDKAKIRIILSNPVYVKSTDAVFDYLSSLGIAVYGIADGVHGLLRYNKQKTVLNDNGRSIKVDRSTNDWLVAMSNHEGIIEGSDWIEVQKILELNKNKCFSSARTHNAILTGMLRCNKCGSNMTITHGGHSENNKKIFYYRCAMKKNSKGTRCDSKNVRADQIDTVIINSIKEIGCNKESILHQLQLAQKKKKDDTYILDKKGKLENDLEQKQKQINNLVDKISLNIDLEDIFIEKVKILKQEIEELKQEIDKCVSQEEQQENEELTATFIQLLLDKCSIIDTLTIDEKKLLVRGLFKKITWDSDTQTVEATPIFASEISSSEDDKKK